MNSRFLYCSALLTFGCCINQVLLFGDDRVPDFELEIAPILIKRCVECHQTSNASADLVLTHRQGLISGGESGAAIDLKDPQSSFLLQRIKDGEMPPEEKGKARKLPEREIALLTKWIAAGVHWPTARRLDWFEQTTETRAGRDWWSLQPITKPAVPQLEQFPQPDNPIDAFVLSRIEQQQLAPAPRADKRVLIRRLFYDLIGLPPTTNEIRAFLADDSPGSWERLIDELLQRPQYGERWARYWLDVARYADTSGYERDQEKPFAWKYRDWVVNALNDDMPFSRFVAAQLAGDEIEDRTEQSLIATGFLRLGSWNDEPNDPADYKYERLEDLVHTTASAFLGLTVKCARCHAHKFDPITQADYYRMASVFWPGPIASRDSKWLGGPSDTELNAENVLAWTDLSANPPPIYLLKNGEREHPVHPVAPGSLSSIPYLERSFKPPLPEAKTTGRRLQLARWIADPHNPLAARVFVNRLWQHHFGEGLVRTPNNFGFLADPATHPELLDWLAAEFIANGGHAKPIHKLILSSQTWRQSSLHPDYVQYQSQDPSNRLYWHAPRRRLDAESLRDSILATTGQLELKLGGEPFKPMIAPEALEGLSKKSAAYQASPRTQQMRRSLYMYLKRGLLPPMLSTFDLCDPTGSCGRRSVTTVPTQALALLNNRFVHDQSEHLAATIIASTGVESEQVRQVWLNILKRIPTDQELNLAKQHLEVQRRLFLADNAKAGTDQEVTADRLTASMVVHLKADQAITDGSDNRIVGITNLVDNGIDLVQPIQQARPKLLRDGFGGKPTIQFSGEGQFLNFTSPPIADQRFTMIAVINDRASSGHRAIVSNWNSKNNVGTSMFLGLTGKNTVRFSDVFAEAGQIDRPSEPFIIAAVNGYDSASIYQNGRQLRVQSVPLSTRKLDTPWVIGQQGNIDGEYWNGGVAEIRIFNNALSDSQRRGVEFELAKRYGIALAELGTSKHSLMSREEFALASLCHVLLNSNEFIYID